jgi:hypothetical protein
MKFYRRLKVSRKKAHCTVCNAVAVRFKDVEFTRTWYCADHIKEIENGKETSIGTSDRPSR